MKKGIISLAIVLAMVVSMFVPAFAVEDVVEPLVIDFADEEVEFGELKQYKTGYNPPSAVVAGSSQYNSGEKAWELKVTTVGAEADFGAGFIAAMPVPGAGDLEGYGYFAVVYKCGAEGTEIKLRNSVANGTIGNQDGQGSVEFANAVAAIPDTGFGSNQLGIWVENTAGTNGNRPIVGDTVYIAAVAFFATEAEANDFDLEAYRGEGAPTEPVTDIYFDNNRYYAYADAELNAYVSEDGKAIIIDKTFAQLGGFHCTTHLNCLDLIDEAFFGEYPEAFIQCQVTKNAKYAKVDKPEYVEELGGIRFTVTPIDNYITKDIDIEIQMYVIRNEAQQAHRSNTVKFDLSITNRYIDDDDIAAIAGEDCSLFIDEDKYVVKGSQFEEAGDKSVSIAWWNAKKPNDSKFVINFESVVGQNGINFGSSLVTKGLLDEAVKAVKDLNKDAKWDGIAFGSEEVIVNGATVSILNSFGETFKYAYQLDAEGNLTYVGEYTKDAKYIEFEVEAGEALGSFLVSDKKIETAPVEPDEPSEDEDDKDAPGTGAGANMMGLAVFAVVALAGAAVVASKK